jgi:aspartyl-tRNA(Asn)/glutamyl-tRNA(Gln) amidotransferase subunit C
LTASELITDTLITDYFLPAPPSVPSVDCAAGAFYSLRLLMKATKFDVRYTAELARIKLTAAEIATFESQLGHVLEHVEKLNQLDVSAVEPTAHSFPIYNIFREDKTRPGLDREAALANAPRQAQGLFIVTKVVE